MTPYHIVRERVARRMARGEDALAATFAVIDTATPEQKRKVLHSMLQRGCERDGWFTLADDVDWGIAKWCADALGVTFEQRRVDLRTGDRA